MTEQQIAAILKALKVDLGMKLSTSYDERLTEIIQSSYKAIVSEGAATLNADDPEDFELIVIYAAWLWDNRRTGDGKPRMLVSKLNNRILGEKART